MIKTVRDFLTSRKQSYVRTFSGITGDAVLEDLARFCRADESTFHPDPRLEGLLQGRREVWLRITKHLNLTPDELIKYFNPKGE
tara:strand:+ start:370 stop:621 length:252 start_codon:yes stop_codon:yes gene_type:complete